MSARSWVLAAVMSAVVGFAIWKSQEAPKSATSTAPESAVQSRVELSKPAAPQPSNEPFLVAARTAASTGPVKPSSFSGERDLWAFAHRSAAGGGNANVYEALAAAAACQQFLAASPQLSAFIDGGKSAVQGERTPERQQAIVEMKSRCAGFEQNEEEGKVFAKELNARLSGTAYVMSSARIPKPQLRELLSSDAPDAVAMATMQLLGPWQKKLNIPDNDPREDDLSVALALSRCDFGLDCSSNGALSMDQCIYAGVCGRDFRDVLSTSNDQQMVARINGYRQQIVEAIKNRNWAAIGL